MIDGYATETRAGEQGPVVVRTATTDAARHLLAQEADRLGRSRHPGVVELLEVADNELTIAWAGAQTLELLGAPIPVLCGVLTSVASTVADLHEIGIIHGRIDATHVVIDAEGRPRLCGMRGPGPDERPPLPTDDVAAIGDLIDHLVGLDTEIGPIPERRWSRRRWTGYQRRALQLVADRATHEDPARRQTARELAAAIAEAIPDAQLVAPPTSRPETPPPPPTIEPQPETAPGAEPTAAADRSEQLPPLPPLPSPPTFPRADEVADEVAAPQPAESPTPGPVGAIPGDPAPATFLGLRIESPEPGSDSIGDRPPRTSPDLPSRRTAVLVATVIALVVTGLVLGFGIISSDRPADTASGSPPAPPVTAAPAISPTSTPAQTTSEPTLTRCPLTAVTTGPDLDGDGCPDPVEIDGTRVTADGVSFEVGEKGDRVEVADWNCDGKATAAIVRPGTGEIFVFTRWVMAEEPVSVTPTTVVPGAVALMEPDDGPCTTHHLVRVVGGTTVPVDLQVDRP